MRIDNKSIVRILLFYLVCIWILLSIQVLLTPGSGEWTASFNGGWLIKDAVAGWWWSAIYASGLIFGIATLSGRLTVRPRILLAILTLWMAALFTWWNEVYGVGFSADNVDPALYDRPLVVWARVDRTFAPALVLSIGTPVLWFNQLGRAWRKITMNEMLSVVAALAVTFGVLRILWL